jgi:xanthine dehydrogenase accessory factor
VSEYWENLQGLLASGRPFASVTLVDVIASAPQNVGAKMLVTADGLYSGTVGGGKIEARSIAEAQAMLGGAGGTASGNRGGNRFVEWNLQRDIGMTCGGVVKLFFETYNIAAWPIVIFGAGHCAQALVRVLMTLQCHVTVIESRREWLEKLPGGSACNEKLHVIEAARPFASYVADLPENAFVLSMTMGHSMDLPVLAEALQSRAFPYLGVIGSDAKAASLKRGLREAGVAEDKFSRFLCPVGLPIGNNDPAEIALSIAAQMLEYRGRMQK